MQKGNRPTKALPWAVIISCSIAVIACIVTIIFSISAAQSRAQMKAEIEEALARFDGSSVYEEIFNAGRVTRGDIVSNCLRSYIPEYHPELSVTIYTLTEPEGKTYTYPAELLDMTIEERREYLPEQKLFEEVKDAANNSYIDPEGKFKADVVYDEDGTIIGMSYKEKE